MKKLSSLMILLILLTGCAFLKTPEIKGVVVDAETGKPIADARIFAVWHPIYSGLGGPSETMNPRKEIRLRTGPDGRFVIPAYWLIDYLPIPLGQGGTFVFNIIALGYKITGYGARTNGEFERGKFKDITIGKENTIKLTLIDNPKDWMENSSIIYRFMKNDDTFLKKEYEAFINKFAYKIWDVTTEDELFKAYGHIGDYRSAIKRLETLIQHYPENKAYYLSEIKRFRSKLGEVSK